MIARNFNRFYNNSSILNADSEDVKKARLALCAAVCDTLQYGLGLRGIDVVEKM